MNSIALCARSVSLKRGKRQLFSNFSAAFATGRLTSVVGPNGVGKSSLLMALAGLLRCDSGHIECQGRPLAQWPRRERARTLAWAGQEEPGVSELTVQELVELGRLPHKRWLAPLSLADQAAVQQALQDCGVWELRQRSVSALSDGERQRVLLARAYAVRAPILLLDEPLAHLDLAHQAQWLRMARALCTQGVTIVAVQHDLTMALAADDMLVLGPGGSHYHGASDDLATHSALQQSFGQELQVHQLGARWVVLAE